jgi:hypothetical protein
MPSAFVSGSTESPARKPPVAAADEKFCKCGCGSVIAARRVFVNREHQLVWLRAEGRRRRLGPDTVPRTEPHSDTATLSSFGQVYTVGFIISALPAFCLTWLYCFAAYGAAGVALGWLPALVVSGVAGAIWPGLAAATLILLTQVV